MLTPKFCAVRRRYEEIDDVGFRLLAVFLSGAVVGAFGHRLYTVRSVYQRRTTISRRRRIRRIGGRNTSKSFERACSSMNAQLGRLNTDPRSDREPLHRRRNAKGAQSDRVEQIRQDQRNRSALC